MPQGNLAERIRAAGAGIGAFFCPTAYGTELAESYTIFQRVKTGRLGIYCQ
ncbi:MAG: CoA-transferase [Syntrophorhabdus sp.]